MIRKLVIAATAMMLGTAPAHAALTSFNFGTPGQTSGTVTYDTVLGAADANGLRNVSVSFTNLFLLGTPIAKTDSIFAVAGNDGGTQRVTLDGFVTSPFFSRADFHPAYELNFRGPAGSLFSGNQLVGAESLIAQFVSGTIQPQPGTTISFGVSSVPEPASWALLVIGVAVVGAAVRRRPDVRQVPVAA